MTNSNNIYDIEDYKPHIALPTLDGNIHILPVALVEKWVSGEVEPDKDCIRAILKEWLTTPCKSVW